MLVAAMLGLLPPAVGDATPPTVVRKVAVATSTLVPPRAAAALGPGATIRLGRPAWSARRVVCAPIRFTTLGVVWRQDGGEEVPARLAVGAPGRFGPMIEVEGEPAEAPDPGTADAAGLEGTPPVWTGEARCVRVRLGLPEGDAIGDVTVVFVNTSGTASPPSMLDRAGDILARAWGMVTHPYAAETAEATAVQPGIITRAGWGAKEKLRRCGPEYAEDGLKMAYVHHTVNSNSYARSRSDDLIRGIYAYHVQGRHFCDIAYNFLIDRFGRIFEGRFGGIDQPVIGAHAMGFNTGSTGVAALGTFTSTKAPARMLRAFKRLLAWRLDVAHLRPTGQTVMVSAGGSAQKFEKGEEVTLPVISGHRHTGYTTCPGTFLFRKLGPIRRAAEARGLPKIWNPARSAEAISLSQLQTVQLTATLSEPMSWTVRITDSLGASVRWFAGSGTVVDATWDGKRNDGTPVAPGTYTVTIRAETAAGTEAREAVLSVVV
ncbi:MAG TPA: N-acetylmuramoyl-L-alanine amidase, partial [Actinomycetota bacterium]|nr:N-acetylmuramoyl-L-alanine amidase [Actinomycetota bacterium]